MSGWRAMSAACLILAAAWGAAAAAQDRDTIIPVHASDAEMNAASARARAELPSFYRRLAAPGADENLFMVKFDILPGSDAEYVWAAGLDRSTSPMTGTLLSQPEMTEHRAGQRVAIAEADIIDWGYFRGEAMQGAYTQRVLLDRMEPAEAARIRAAMGW